MMFDSVVLGAGIVGVSTAIHLQQRGHAVALVDLRAPGQETSYGNGGLIQREGVYPYAFPRGLRALLRYAGNRANDVRYHLRDVGQFAPFLAAYWRYSHPARHAAIARNYATLITHCVDEHRALAQAAGARGLMRSTGWIKVFRTPAVQDAEAANAARWHAEFGVGFALLDAAQLRAAEPDLDTSLVGGLHYTDAESVSDPGALVTAYAALFVRLGGRIFLGDAKSLRESGGRWVVHTQDGDVDAKHAVIALGPWADDVTTRLGYRLPLAVKRGYHMHYAPRGGAQLHRPVLDAENGFLLAPMARGIRLTTGVELADRDAPKTPVQLAAVEPVARTLFPLGERLDAEPWMGRRPCTPDMMPVIGPAPRHKGLWFAFGHAHHGLTLGPVTGRLIAEMITGETPFVDPSPFRANRF
ncbi:NAD(P)/FAD-dependent oxidoreductase [Pandoraea terrae]|uniref:NAD(P)/FAD-dependent oxidoreductase n=1 Tax=Pandoraea terrae TaxID=1537710 RepID=UPI0012421987|nr:FAD-binding oxidoreductase [Pandoraea terrae]